LLIKIDRLLGPEALAEVTALLATAQFEDGKSTAGQQARGVKNNQQARAGDAALQKIQAITRAALDGNAGFISAALPRRVAPALVNRHAEGMAYGPHVDNAIMGREEPLRSDVSMTLWLSDPRSYDGGELVIDDPMYGHQVIKLAAGNAFLYPSTTIHRVNPVTRGVRHAAVFWIQSLVRSPEQRRILFELDLTVISLRKKDAAAPELTTLTSIYHNLLRQWAET
jgi:PKHD-type hydroxylase